MSVGRVVSGVVASVAVAACAVVVIRIGLADRTSTAEQRRLAPVAAETSHSGTSHSGTAHSGTAHPGTTQLTTGAPGAVAATGVPTRESVPVATTSARPAPVAPAGTPVSVPAVAAGAAPSTVTPAVAPRRASAAPASHAAAARTPAPAPVTVAARGVALPLPYSTGNATRVITVTAPSYGSTTATLQPWTKMPGGGWRKQGSAIHAHIGADGMSTHPSESSSATPVGSFTLTQAFGYYSNPGTPLPYFKTTLSDYWISTPGGLYNTHQRCGSCGYDNGVNERLATETPFYNYAVVIDYNTRNAPGGVHQGAGSAFFLHVTDGSATAGCVAIPQSRLVPIVRWLNPRTHPRILIGVS